MRHRRRSAVGLALIGAQLAFGACAVSLDDPAGRACDQNHECAGGRVCIEGLCRAPADGDGGVTDAPSAGDAADGVDAARFCPNQPANLALCDDFDEGPLGAKWDGGQGVLGATRALDSTDFISPPNSLLFSSAPWDGGYPPAFALLNQGLSSSVTHVHVEFDWRMDHLGDPGVALNEAYVFVFQSGGYYLRLKVMPNGALSVEQDAPKQVDAANVLTSFPFAQASDPTKWSHITFDVSLAPAYLIVTQNGVEQINTTKSGANIDPQAATGKRAVGIGLYWASSTDWLSRYDNVTIAAN